MSKIKKVLKSVKDFFINEGFKYWLGLNKKILKNKFNWLLIVALLILCYADIIPRSCEEYLDCPVSGTWASVMVVAILWGHLCYIEWLRDEFQRKLDGLQNKQSAKLTKD